MELPLNLETLLGRGTLHIHGKGSMEIKCSHDHHKECLDIMSQVQFTLSLSVTQPSNPLQITPASGSASFQVGVANSVVLGAITGGTAPYTPSVDPSSPSQLPPGLGLSVDANNNLVLSGTATVAGSGTILIDVNDSAGASASASVKTNATK